MRSTAQGGTIVKLHKGTWHAGPLYAPPDVSGCPVDGADGGVAFYNLELADTNVTDHTNWEFAKEDGLSFTVTPPAEEFSSSNKLVYLVQTNL